jgi:hypothetical protein
MALPWITHNEPKPTADIAVARRIDTFVVFAKSQLDSSRPPKLSTSKKRLFELDFCPWKPFTNYWVILLFYFLGIQS